ncbi:efflux RND transporter periplasmic adaptor subunit [Brevibacterium sp. JNUCC-42]|nr:efflux RND transporter periplasmic adaptor subunit [Brevibacterium sp. JNUCC-42]
MASAEVDASKLYAVIGVREVDVNSVTVDQKVIVEIQAIHETRQGKVVQVSPIADVGTDKFTVKVLLDNTDLRLRPGMTGLVKINEKMK